MKQKYWTKEEETLLTLWKEKGWTYADIGIELGRTENAVKARAGKLNLRNNQIIYTDKELIHILKNHPDPTYNNFCKEKPHATAYVRRFGSWNKALKKAGIPINKCSYKPNKTTYLYLVYFIKENFYKIGITQQGIEVRLKNYPEYSIIYKERGVYNFIKDKEQQWLENIKDYKYIPKHPKFSRVYGQGGKTECFKIDY